MIGTCFSSGDPFDNFTAIYSFSDNSNSHDHIYFGATYSGDSAISRQVYNRTLKDDIKGVISNIWMNKPQFAGSFDIGDQVLFFFRELAVEVDPAEPKIYSRVSKICKHDVGGNSLLRDKWTSYQKARLNCSIPGDFPIYFDEIQDVVTKDNRIFYGLFTTRGSLPASAICAFNLSDIKSVLDGPFKEQRTPNSYWTKATTVPSPRPGQCTNDSLSLPNDVLQFIVDHPLMHLSVQSIYGRPIFVLKDEELQKLEIHRNMTELVFYAGSNRGNIYKLFYKNDNTYTSNIFSAGSLPVWSLKHSGNSVFIGTDTNVIKIDVVTCEQYLCLESCIKDPHCAWINNTDNLNDYIMGNESQVHCDKGCISVANINEHCVVNTTTHHDLTKPVQHRCLSSERDTTTPSESGQTTRIEQVTTTLQQVYCEDNVFVPDLNKIVKFPIVSVGSVVQSTDICITNKKPLVTAKCYGDPTELKDFIINENCIFQDLSTSTVMKDLQILTTIKIDSGNVKSIIETTKNLTTDPEILTSRDIIYVAEILVPISNISSLDEQTLSDTIDTVDNVLNVTPEKLKIAQDGGSATNRILEVLDMIPRTLDLHGKSKIQIHRENLLMEVYDLSSQAPLVTGIQITDGKTHPLTNSTIQTLIEGTYVNIDKVDAAIVLPVGLSYDRANATRVIMNIFRNWGLFSERSDIKDFKPNSRVISAQISVNGTPIRSLGHDTVQAYFFPRNETNKTECGYWDYNINDFSGGWATGGCKLNRTQSGRHVCVCDHLTNFAVLINIGGQDTLDDNLAINIISWIGLGLSVAGLSFTVLSFILFKHLRKGKAQQTLFNLAFSLLCFLIVFIVGIEKTHDYYGCIVVAALLHYFVLVAFMWMLIEGILQYLGLVKVFPTYIPRFILKTAIPAWGIPLIPVSIVLGLDYRLYRGGDKACWMSNSAFYYAFLTPVATIILVNLIIFVMTLRNILVRHKGLQSNQSEKKRAMTNLRVAFSQFILLGLTWIFGFFTIEEASKIFQYIFTTLNVFQGFFIFLLFTARQKQTRQSWKKLCCKQKPKEKYAKKDRSSDQTSESKSYDNDSAYQRDSSYSTEMEMSGTNNVES